jgi:hypothetical protein
MGNVLEAKQAGDDLRHHEEEEQRKSTSLSGVSIPPPSGPVASLDGHSITSSLSGPVHGHSIASRSGLITSLDGYSITSSLSGPVDGHSATSRSGLLDWQTITHPSVVPPPPPLCSSGTSVEWHSIGSASDIPQSPPPCSGTSLEWHIKSYTVGNRKHGKCKTILRDIGTRLCGPCSPDIAEREA